jgi:hypothetical protein
MMRSTLAGGLQRVYIGGSNDPYRGGLSPHAPPTGVPVRARSGPTSDSAPPAQASCDGPRSAHQKLAFTL